MVAVVSNGLRKLPPTSVGKADLGGREGVWHHLDPWDSACLRTASVELNVPGKYGPHGELFFFLIQKDLASMPGIETCSPFFTADIGTPSFSADVLEKCALIGMHQTAEEGRGGKGGGQNSGFRRHVEVRLPKEFNVEKRG